MQDVHPAVQQTLVLNRKEKHCMTILTFNPLNAKLNPICHLLALFGAHHILHVSGVRVNFVLSLGVEAMGTGGLMQRARVSQKLTKLGTEVKSHKQVTWNKSVLYYCTLSLTDLYTLS